MSDKQDDKNAFEEAGNEKEPGFVAEFFEMLMDNKKYWMIPIVVVLIIFGGLILFGGGGSAAAPFIYTLF